MTPSRARTARRCSAAMLAGAAAALSWTTSAPAAALRRVEVVQVSGIIDAPVERALVRTIEGARRDGAALVVIQLSSRGSVGRDRTVRVARAVAASEVPVVTWVAPAGAAAENGAVLIALASRLRAMAPGSTIGPVRTLDLRSRQAPGTLARRLHGRISAGTAVRTHLADVSAPGLEDVLTAADERHVADIDIDTAAIRYHTLDIPGRLLHAAGQPSIAFLLLLAGLVGVVFELFHPSTGPAGVAGLLGVALSVYGLVTLGGSWVGFALVVAGVAGFCVDLRESALGLFTIGGLGALVAGSLLLFPSPYLSVSPWVLSAGIVGMVLFLLGAMTRVLRDLRAVARGEVEVTDAHPHPDGLRGATDDA